MSIRFTKDITKLERVSEPSTKSWQRAFLFCKKILTKFVSKLQA